MTAYCNQYILEPYREEFLAFIHNKDVLCIQTQAVFRIAVIHIKDYKTETGPRTCMAAGTGDMDYRPILKFAKEKKPFIHATLENTKPENAQQALEFLRNLENSL